MEEYHSLMPPNGYINNYNLEVVHIDHMKYLGTVIFNCCNNSCVNESLRVCSGALYSLQGAGLCNNGLNIEKLVHL